MNDMIYTSGMIKETSQLQLEGKTALITGGTRGIGYAIAQRFCQEGASAVIVGRAKGAGSKAAESLRDQGYSVHFEAADMADVDSIKEMVGRAVAKLDSVDTLINNAGILTISPIRKLEQASWERVLATNLTGAVFCMQAVAAHMAERGKGGSVVNMSSIAGIDGGPGLVGYAASKAGIIAATRVGAVEFARNGIRVNAIAPGIIETEMTGIIPDTSRQASIRETPLGRLGIPEDIAGVAAFLASDNAGYITGQVLRVDGGLSF